MVNIVSVHKYAGLAREIANRIKNPADITAINQAAEEMAEYIPDGATLVPAPPSDGISRAMLVLAERIAQVVPGSTMIEAVVRRHPMPSKALLRRTGRPLPGIQEQIDSMEVVDSLSSSDNIWVVDNVVVSGDTLKSMELLLGAPLNAIVYAESTRGRTRIQENPPMGRICVSGSRNYTNLENVDSVFSVLPKDLLIVHGGAEGVDARANKVAARLGFDVDIWKADWKRYGRAAGPIRNREMVESCDFLLAFWDLQSRGTASAISAAVSAGIPFGVIEDC